MMVKQRQANKAPPNRQKRRPYEPDDRTGVAGSADAVLDIAEDHSLEAQAARLEASQLQGAQRLTLAAQIAQMHGNQHLQRLIIAQHQPAARVSLRPDDSFLRAEDEESAGIPPQTQPDGRSVSAITSDFSNPKIAGLARALNELAKLAQFADGQHAGIKWEKLAGEELESNRHYQEKSPEDRDKIVQAVTQVRTLIQGLTTVELGVDRPTLAQVQAYYFNRLNTLTPYYTQMANLDVLYTGTTVKDKKGVVTIKKQHEAWERTCNVTSMAMTLEGLGVKIEDFKGSAALMERIAAHYEVHNVTGLRLPDFLQLVAIYLSFKKRFPDADLASLQPDDFAEKVSTARTAAADLILFSGRFDEFTTLFGVKATLVTNPLEKSLTRMGELHRTDTGIAGAEKSITDLEKEIRRLEESLSSAKDKQKPGIQKRIEAKGKALEQKQKALEQRKAGKQKQIEQYVDSDIKQTEQDINKLEGEYSRLEKKLQKVKASQKSEIEKRMSTVQEQINVRRATLEEQRAERTGRIAGFEGELEAAAPIENYRNSVLNPLRSALESGKQVIAARVSHFVRLESLSETEIIIDDPADRGKDFKMTWEEARQQGFFLRYIILEK